MHFRRRRGLRIIGTADHEHHAIWKLQKVRVHDVRAAVSTGQGPGVVAWIVEFSALERRGVAQGCFCTAGDQHFAVVEQHSTTTAPRLIEVGGCRPSSTVPDEPYCVLERGAERLR